MLAPLANYSIRHEDAARRASVQSEALARAALAHLWSPEIIKIRHYRATGMSRHRLEQIYGRHKVSVALDAN